MSRHLVLKLVAAGAMAMLWAQAAQAQQESGMVAVRDAQTGNMRAPTATELRALRGVAGPATAQGTPQAQPATVRADGTRSIKLGERGMVYSVVTRDPGGKLAEQCVQGADAAERALGAAPATQPSREHSHEHE